MLRYIDTSLVMKLLDTKIVTYVTKYLNITEFSSYITDLPCTSSWWRPAADRCPCAAAAAAVVAS